MTYTYAAVVAIVYCICAVDVATAAAVNKNPISLKAFYAAKLSSTSVTPKIPLQKASGAVSVIIFNATYAVGMVELKNINNFYMAHIHSGAKGVNGPIAVWSLNSSLYGVFQPISTTKLSSTWSFNPSVGNVTGLLATGKAYYNAHNTAYPNGTIRGQFTGLAANRGGGGAVIYDNTFAIPINVLNVTSIDIRVLCDVRMEYIFVPRLTCDLSLPKILDAGTSKPLMVSVNTQMLWDAIFGEDGLKKLIDPIVAALASLGK